MIVLFDYNQHHSIIWYNQHDSFLGLFLGVLGVGL